MGIEVREKPRQHVETIYRRSDITDIIKAKVPMKDSMSGLLQKHKNCLNSFYVKGINETIALQVNSKNDANSLIEHRNDDQILKSLYHKHF